MAALDPPAAGPGGPDGGARGAGARGAGRCGWRARGAGAGSLAGARVGAEIRPDPCTARGGEQGQAGQGDDGPRRPPRRRGAPVGPGRVAAPRMTLVPLRTYSLLREVPAPGPALPGSPRRYRGNAPWRGTFRDPFQAWWGVGARRAAARVPRGRAGEGAVRL